MADLPNDKTSMCFAGRGQSFERVKSFTLRFFCTWNDGIAGCFELVLFDHDVACEDNAELAFAPSLVDIYQIV